MDGKTDMTKLIDSFRNFANAPKNSVLASENKLRVCQQANLLMLFRQTVAVYCDSHMKLVGLIWNFSGKNAGIYFYHHALER